MKTTADCASCEPSRVSYDARNVTYISFREWKISRHRPPCWGGLRCPCCDHDKRSDCNAVDIVQISRFSSLLSLVLCENLGIGGGLYRILFQSGGSEYHGLVLNLPNETSPWSFLLATEIESVFIFPVSNQVPMRWDNLYSVEAPDRPQNNM